MAGIAWLLAMLAGCVVWKTGAAAPSDTDREWRDGTAVSQPIATGRPDREWQFAAPRRDMYGNQVDEAVGDYRIDPRGDLFERHAPDTAVLELGPPDT